MNVPDAKVYIGILGSSFSAVVRTDSTKLAITIAFTTFRMISSGP